jgi:hypothetical protein
MGLPILKLVNKNVSTTKAMGRALRDGPKELFFSAGYWTGHFEWVENRIRFAAVKKSVPQQPRHFLSSVESFYENETAATRIDVAEAD